MKSNFVHILHHPHYFMSEGGRSFYPVCKIKIQVSIKLDGHPVRKQAGSSSLLFYTIMLSTSKRGAAVFASPCYRGLGLRNRQAGIQF